MYLNILHYNNYDDLTRVHSSVCLNTHFQLHVCKQWRNSCQMNPKNISRKGKSEIHTLMHIVYKVDNKQPIMNDTVIKRNSVNIEYVINHL